MAAVLKPTRYLTKSRFMAAVECPTKLFYLGKPEYRNDRAEDSFLEALAEGGHQVEALARLMYPGGVLVEAIQEEAIERTRELLTRDDVIIYDAALASDGLLVRADILRKRGPIIELVEVKSKSYNPPKHGDLRGSKGALNPDFVPYLKDVAFQLFVARLAYPQYDFRPFLMMADTSRVATVDGLNQRFRVHRAGQRTRVILAPGAETDPLGEPILTAVGVAEQVAEVLAGRIAVQGAALTFAEAATAFAEAYQSDRRIAPQLGAECGRCQFRTPSMPTAGGERSGFHECWSSELGWTSDDFLGGTVLELWNFKKKDDFIRQGVYRQSQLTAEDLAFDESEPGEQGMSHKHRQWFQASGRWPGGGTFFLDKARLGEAMRTWRYPLHFIDFETCIAPIPFTSGRRPYETIAFQFSHHVLTDDGRLEHKTQFLDVAPRRNPNEAFVRALREALKGDDGTVFRWAPHENTVLLQMREQLLSNATDVSDCQDLVRFIEKLTTRKSDKGDIVGSRTMVDLCKLSEKFFFHPMTKGSSSLKKVLPALMSSSACLEDVYGQAIYGSAAMPSLNCAEPVAWWRQVNGQICDPYDLLPPVFADMPKEEQTLLELGLPEALQEGGTAMAAYVRLQSEEMEAGHRHAIEEALLRYCELDTLAMVMVVQAWSAWIREGDA